MPAASAAAALVVEDRGFHAQYLVQFRAGGGVLQEHFFLGKDEGHGTERGQRAFVEPAQDQLLLAGVGVDVAPVSYTHLFCAAHPGA